MAWYEVNELLPRRIVKKLRLDDEYMIAAFTINSDDDPIFECKNIKIGDVTLNRGMGGHKTVISAHIEYCDKLGGAQREIIYFKIDANEIKSRLADGSTKSTSLDQFKYMSDPSEFVRNVKFSVMKSDLGVKLLEMSQTFERDTVIKFPTERIVHDFKHGLAFCVIYEINKSSSERMYEFTSLDVDKLCKDFMDSVEVDIDDQSFTSSFELDVKSAHYTGFGKAYVCIASDTPIRYRLSDSYVGTLDNLEVLPTTFNQNWFPRTMTQVQECDNDIVPINADPDIMIKGYSSISEVDVGFKDMSQEDFVELMKSLGYDDDLDDEQDFLDVRSEHRRETVCEFVRHLAKSGRTVRCKGRQIMFPRIVTQSFMSALLAYK